MKYKNLVMLLLLLHLFFQSLVVFFFRLVVSMYVCLSSSVGLSVCQMHDHDYISVGMADASIVSVCGGDMLRASKAMHSTSDF